MNKVRIDTVVSDLFFNHTHNHHEALCNQEKDGPTWEERAEAILKDAKEFVEAYRSIDAIGEYSAQDFANDFMARL